MVRCASLAVLNLEYSQKWPRVTQRRKPAEDPAEFDDLPDKLDQNR